MKPIIGITLARRPEEKQAYVNENYGEAVRLAGGLPVFLSGEEGEAEELADKLDGLLLSGGPDLEPALYGRENQGSRGIDERRDAFELALFRAVRKRRKPVFGICRGMQLIQCALGGGLVQDIREGLSLDHPNGHAGQEDAEARHTVTRLAGSFLEKFFPERFPVNSFHHQCADLSPAPGLRYAAFSENGRIPEALEAEDGSPLWGVQWHPEKMISEDARMEELFRMLVDAARTE